MSIRGVLIGVEKRLKDQPDCWSEAEVSIMPDGKPAPAAGQKFFAVYPVRFRNIDDNPLGFEFVFDVGVCITYRYGYSPQDRTGRQIALAKAGLAELAETVVYRLHGDYDVLNFANAEIPESRNKIGEPLVFREGQFDARGPEWFGAEADAKYVGWSVDLHFHGGKILQPLPLG